MDKLKGLFVVLGSFIFLFALLAMAYTYALLFTEIDVERLDRLSVALKESALSLSITGILSYIYGYKTGAAGRSHFAPTDRDA